MIYVKTLLNELVMNEHEIDIDDFSDEEIQQYLEEADNEYNEWNINLTQNVEKLSNSNKIFLNQLYENHGEKIFYIIFGYLNSDTLVEYDEMSENGVSEFLQELNNEDTLNFVELLIEFNKQEIELVEEEVDFEKIIAKLKRDVGTLKKKLAQPTKYINTKQFEERYALSPLQQKSLRSKLNDSLPFIVINNRIFYEPEIIDKWMENFDRHNY